MLRLLLMVAWLASMATAQVVRLANHGGPFEGWIRTTIDTYPPHQVGKVGDVRYVVGRRAGADDLRVVDLRVTLAAGERRTVDLAAAQPDTWTREPLPKDLLGHFGGPAAVSGRPLEVVRLVADGAGYLAHLRGRPSPTSMWHVDLWVTWWPDSPGWAAGEVLLTASNSAIPDLVAWVPEGLRLTWGDAIVLVAGAPAGGAGLAPAGARFADGQARAFPVTFVWWRHMRAADWSGLAGFAHRSATAVGVQRLWHDGNPRFHDGFSSIAWARQHLARSWSELHSWGSPQLWTPADSGQGGGVEDHAFHPGGEALRPDGVGAETVRYLAALRGGGWVVHHLEVGGDIVSKARHPGLLYYYGRPYRTGSDTLGKPRVAGGDIARPSIEQANGWDGISWEHDTWATLASASRLTGSPALQHLIRHRAHRYLIERTLTPGWGTTGPHSARELFWEAMSVVHVWRGLEERPLAEQVAAHWRARMRQVILPWIGSRDVWDVRTETSAAVPIVPGWMPWQQAGTAYAIDLACRVVGGVPEAHPIALAAAKRVLADCWVQNGTRWEEWDRLALSGQRSRSGFYTTAWLPCAIAVVLRYEPNNTKARAIWQQMLADTANGGATHAQLRGWLPPGVAL
jgi:hypothetical protein